MLWKNNEIHDATKNMQDRAYVVGWCKVVAPTADVALASEALHPFDTAAPASDVKKYVDELKLKTML